MSEQAQARQSAAEILSSYAGPHLRIMEVCGTHTHEIFRLGIRKLLPPQVDLISGPGCPVCVTPVGFIDEAIWILGRVGEWYNKLGGTLEDTEPAPMDYEIRANPMMQGDACLAVEKAQELGLTNFSLLTANKTMPNAYAALRDSADVFLYPGHVHAITGTQLCEDLAEQGVSGVLAGFTAKELITALAVAVRKAEEGKPFFVNAYPRVVKPEGTPAAVALIEKVMEPCDSEWRGLGVIPQSGLALREEYAAFDARKKYDMPHIEGRANPACRCGDVLRGACKPSDCPVFGKGCTPMHPVGACMVSGEGACSAYYQYGGGVL